MKREGEAILKIAESSELLREDPSAANRDRILFSHSPFRISPPSVRRGDAGESAAVDDSVPERGVAELGVVAVDDVLFAPPCLQKELILAHYLSNDPELVDEIVVVVAVRGGLNFFGAGTRVGCDFFSSKDHPVSLGERSFCHTHLKLIPLDSADVGFDSRVVPDRSGIFCRFPNRVTPANWTPSRRNGPSAENSTTIDRILPPERRYPNRRLPAWG